MVSVLSECRLVSLCAWPSLLGAVSAVEVLVPLAAAMLGAASVALVSRHLRRQELYVQAAQKINGYLDDAADALNEMVQGELDSELAGRAKRAVNLAVFHSRRLESREVTARLEVADFVLWDMLTYEDPRGRLWAYRAIDDAMGAVVEFMILPRMWPPRRSFRKLSPNRFPNRVDLYKELAKSDDDERLDWRAVRLWVRERDKYLREAEER